MAATRAKPRKKPNRSSKPVPGKKNGKGQIDRPLTEQEKLFIEQSSVESGLSLMDQVLLAVKDGADHNLGDIFKVIKDRIPESLVASSGSGSADKDTKAFRFFLLTKAAEKLLGKKLLLLSKPGDKKDLSKESVVRLPTPESDERFEIDPEFRYLLPPPSESELAALEYQILTEGCRKPLTVWESGKHTYLVNGHTRLAICQRHGKKYELDETKQPNREAVINWIWTEHLGQRNFNRVAESYARGRRFNAMKLEHGGARKGERSKSQNATLKKAAKSIARTYGVNRATLFRDAKFAKGLDGLVQASGQDEIRSKVLSRDIRLSVKEVTDLSAKKADEIRQAVGKLLEEGKVRQKRKKAGKATAITLPGKSKEQAPALFKALGAERARELIEELSELIKKEGADRVAANAT